MPYSFTAYFEHKVLAKRPYRKRVRLDKHPQRLPGSEIQAMRIEYFPETDTLYIDLAGRAGVDAREIGEGIVVDLDANGRAVGIELDQASAHLDLATLDVRHVPFVAGRTPG